MKTDTWKIIENIYDQALTLKPEEQDSFIKKQSKGNNELYKQVSHMLKLDDEDNFMSGIPTEITSDALSAQSDATQIGHFEIIEKIATGGMGVVYKAQSTLSDVKINLALKTIRNELKNADLESRFFNEKTILAKLKHKNIASLIDAGITEKGVPYIATEWIQGDNILSYCDKKVLGLKARLKLFQQLCSAVSHAHNQFIIHRDIKPANILIDDSHQVKLLDFGIAKLIEEDNLNATQTQIFTPNYAAPEQINGKQCTAVTDVYALGVLLYELLTAQKRFKLDSLSISERINLICDPTVINASDADFKNQHPINIHKLKGPLNTIINKAMHVDKERRYQSVALLIDDINRYTNNRPINAIKDSWYYRFKMFITRNFWSSVLASLVVVSLVTGIVISQHQANIAKNEALKSKQIHAFYKKSLHSASPIEGGSTTITVREMFVNGAQIFNLDTINDPLMRAELASEIGLIFAELEEFELSRKYIQLAIDFYANDIKKFASEYLHYSIRLASFLSIQQNHKQALSQIQLAYSQVNKSSIESSVLADFYINIGTIHKELNQIEDALMAYDQAETIAEKINDSESLGKINYYKYALLGERESNVYLNELLFKAQFNFEQSYESENHPDLLALRNSLAMRLTAQGDYIQADAVFEKLFKQVSLNTEKISYENHINRANVKYYLGEFEETIELTTTALERMNELKLPPSFTEMAAIIIQARALTALNQFDQSDILYNQAYTYFSEVFDDSHKIIKTLNTYRIDNYLKSGQIEQALELSIDLDNYAEKQLTESPSNQNRYINIMLSLANLQSQLNNHKLALDYFQRADSVLQINTKKQGWIYWVIQAGIEKSYFKLNNNSIDEKYHSAINHLFDILDNNNCYYHFFNLQNEQTKT